MRALLVLSLVFITSCAAKPTVSEHQCRAGDWHTVGYRDGSQGLASTQLLRHQEACGAHGIYLSRDEYMAGWDAGLEQFCNPDNAFDLGRRGAGYRGICASDAFTNAYQQGKSLYQAQQAVQHLDRQLANAEQRLIDIRQEIIGASTAQLTPDLTTQQRVALLAKVESLYTERTRIEADLPELQAELAERQRHLDALNQSLAYGY